MVIEMELHFLVVFVISICSFALSETAELFSIYYSIKVSERICRVFMSWGVVLAVDRYCVSYILLYRRGMSV